MLPSKFNRTFSKKVQKTNVYLHVVIMINHNENET